MDTIIISREVARRQGLKQYHTGKPCLRGHAVWRSVSNGQCSECTRGWNAGYRAADPERTRKQVRAWRVKWYAENTAEANASAAITRATKLHAMPPGTNRADLLPFYVTSHHKTKSTGIPHGVDHYIPYKGKNAEGEHVVCGLHVPANLQVITAKENSRKGSRFNPETHVHQLPTNLQRYTKP